MLKQCELHGRQRKARRRKKHDRQGLGWKYQKYQRYWIFFQNRPSDFMRYWY
jgi:hypothetical protein